MRNDAIEAVGSNGRMLRVEFIWRGDRYGHAVSMTDAGGAIVPLLESIEGCSEDNWPPSPPLQTLSIEKMPDGRRVALLVGMAGGSHWSASVEASGANAALIFDIACRHTKEPSWLGSRYRRLSDSASKVAIRGEAAKVSSTEDDIEVQPAVNASAGTSRWQFVLSTEY